MAKVFISYSSKDVKKAQMFAKLLEDAGFDPWWDKNIPPGTLFDKVISKALDTSKCILVLWSKNSIQSDWVLDEAHEAKKRNILVPVMLDKLELPFGFKRYQAVDFRGWRGSSKSENALLILNAISLKTGFKLKKGEELDKSLWEKFLRLLGVDVKEKDKSKVVQSAKALKIDKTKRKPTGGLDGKTIVFTGKLKEPRRIQALKVKALGAKFVDSASRNTNILVVGEKPGAEKLKAAKKHNIYMLDEKEWMDLLNQTYKRLFEGKRVFLTEKRLRRRKNR